MADIRYDYKHVPTIKAFSESKEFVRGLMGPFGSGKSSGCVIELVKWASKQPIGPTGKRRARFGVIRNTYPQLKDTTIKTVEQWLPSEVFGRWVWSEHRYIVDRLDPQIEIEFLFRALDRPEHISNLLSLELTAAWGNEARELPHSIIQALRGRVGRFPAVVDGGCVDPGIILDTNPPDEDSWWYRVFEEERPEGWRMFRQPGGRTDKAENLPYLPQRYYENLQSGATADFVKVYVDGEYGFVRDGKPVYPEYIDSLHCSTDAEYRKDLTVYRGWDFGLMPACVLSHVTPDGRWVTFDELCGDYISLDTFANEVLLRCNTQYPEAKFIDIGDPAGQANSANVKETEASSAFAILNGKRIMMEPGEQTVTIRIESVRKPMNTLIGGRPQLLLHPRCKMLRKGYQGRYQFRRVQVSGDERYKDEPEKNAYSHPHDANQYVAGRLFASAVKSARAGKQKPIPYKPLGIV